LCFLYLDMATGVASALGGVEHTRDALRNHLSTRSSELGRTAEELRQEVQGVLPL
jgi:hypothetical protein